MALIDVVKSEVNTLELASKFPSTDLRIGTQLVVHPGQSAIFVKGGKIYDVFESGTYTLSTSNIPLLNKILNLPFGGNSPFQAEVWFINQVSIMDCKWGTATPLQLEDPKYEVIVPVRAYGQYGFKIQDPQTFLESFVGNMPSFSVDRIKTYFKGRIMSQLTNLISSKLVSDSISILTINSHITDLSTHCKNGIAKDFARFGIWLQSFDIISINPKEDDSSFIKLKEAKDLAARLKITGRDVYQMERSFNVLDTAASNEGGIGGAMMNAGMGLGMGVGMAQQSGMVSGFMNTNPQPQMAPPPPPMAQYHIAINGQSYGPVDTNVIVSKVRSGEINQNTMAWKPGMPGWQPLSTFAEFSSLFCCPPPMTPPSPPTL